MTIINPATFLAFAGVFAGLGLFAARGGTLLKGGLIVAGAFSGSMLWWLTLIAAASAMRRHAPMRLLTAINALLGAVVLGFGVFGVLTFLHTIV